MLLLLLLVMIIMQVTFTVYQLLSDCKLWLNCQSYALSICLASSVYTLWICSTIKTLTAQSGAV